MKLLFLCLFISCSFLAAGQQSKRDSLDKLLLSPVADTNRVNILNKAVGVYFSNNPQKTKQYAEEALALAQKLGYNRGLGRSYNSLGIYHWSQGEFQEAIQVAKQALPYYEALDDQTGIAAVYSTVGLSYKGLGDFSQAFTYYFKSLKINERKGDLLAMARGYNNIGVLFKHEEKYDQALYYYWQSFTKSAGLDDRNQAGVLQNVGQIYLMKGDFPKAITYLNQARARFATLKEPKGLVVCDNNLGETYSRTHQFAQAEIAAQRALQVGTELGYTPSMVTSLVCLGDIRLKTGRATESFAFFDKARALSEQLGQKDGRMNVYKGLAEAHARTGDFKQAYLFEKSWMALKDSLYNDESAKKIARVQAEYQSEKKQAEIELLRKEQQVSQLWRNAIGIGFLATLIIAGLVVSRQRLKIRNDQVLLTQGQVVAEKNQQLESQTYLLENQAVTLTNQAHKLQELDEAKTRFFTNVTHEFRTPLTLIIGTLSDKLHLLAENAEMTIRQSEVQVMHRNAQRLLHLINQLLDLSKIESGQLELQLQSTDIRPLLNLVTALFSSLANQRNVSLLVHLSPHCLSASHDPDQLEKVITNLLSNAFKFTPDRGQISLRAEPVTIDNETFVQIIVDDTGIGITPDQSELVFERFYQGATPRLDRQPGTGLGLSLVKEIVQQHKGSIRIERKAGPGTRFVLLLPLVKPDDEPALQLVAERSQTARYFTATTPQIAAEPSLVIRGIDERPLILIVEDNDDVRTFIRNQMQRQYRVMESENGLQGLSAAQEHMPDLIISDWMMPDMDGIDLCQQLKTDERTCHIPFILLTALSAQDKRLTGLETGADDYLTKPFDSRELLIRTQNLIASRRKLHERFSREIRIQPKDITVTSADEKFLLRVMKIVDDNLGDADFSVEQFGREVGLSRMQLHRKLMALTGQAAGDFIRLMRLKRAAQLLGGHSATVSEIAYEVGFNSLSYFAKCFREQYGYSPTEYQVRQTEPV